jgi:hypothetical protein
MRSIRGIYMARHNTAMSPHLLLLTLDENLRTLLCNGFSVLENEKRGVASEEAVDILEGATGCFGKEEINCRIIRNICIASGELAYRWE